MLKSSSGEATSFSTVSFGALQLTERWIGTCPERTYMMAYLVKTVANLRHDHEGKTGGLMSLRHL